MDYSYFSAHQNPPFQLFGLPTPHQSHTPQPDDFHDSAQPDHFDSSFPNYGQPFHFDGDALVPAPLHSPPESHTKNPMEGAVPQNIASSTTDEQKSTARSSSEEKDVLTPAQSKRKAQNRAAQRAFRERKERHVRELEEKLNLLQQASSTLHEDNERLKRELARVSTENEILRATSSSGPTGAGRGPDAETHITGPMKFTPTDFYDSLIPDGHNREPTHRVTVSEETGEKLLDAGATWDLIQAHELFKKGLVDIGGVCERLRGTAQCDGQGPVFEERLVRRAVEESVAGGSDELI